MSLKHPNRLYRWLRSVFLHGATNRYLRQSKNRNPLIQILPDILITIRDHDTGVEYTLNRKGKVSSSIKSDITVSASTLAVVFEQYREELRVLGYKGADPIFDPDEYTRMWAARKGIEI